jgi:hypothetical protein
MTLDDRAPVALARHVRAPLAAEPRAEPQVVGEAHDLGREVVDVLGLVDEAGLAVCDGG